MLDFGVSKDEFFSTYYEKEFYLKRKAMRASVISWERLDEILYCVDPYPPFMKLYSNGLVPDAHYTEEFNDVGTKRKRLVKSKFYEYMSNGATLVLNRIDWKSPEIRKLCMEVSHFVGEQTVGNGYVAFGGEGTFGKHWDTHDVVILQTLGRKKWQVFRPTFEMPLSSQTSIDRKGDCPVHPVWEGFLEEGDLLYIPKGWWHEALPMDQETFHVSVGIHSPLIIDYVIWACANCLPDLKECRESIPSGMEGMEKIENAFSAMMKPLTSPQTFAAFRSRIFQKERVVSNLNLNMLVRRNADSIHSHSRISLNSAYAFKEFHNEWINGIQVESIPGAAEVVGFLRERQECSFGTLLEKMGAPIEELRAKIYRLAILDIVEVWE